MRTLIFFFILLLGLSVNAQTDSLRLAIEKHRETIKSKFLTLPRSPLDSVSVKYLSYFPAKDSFIFKPTIVTATDSAIVTFPTSSGKTKKYKPYAEIVFDYQSSEHRLTAYESVKHVNHPLYKNILFIPFFDKTNGNESYGGGRYFEIMKAEFDAPDFKLDFNKCFNPWCSYSDGFNCPVPPKNNSLIFEVRAGEKNFPYEH